MLSLENSYNTEDLTQRDEFISKHLHKSVIASDSEAIQEEIQYSYYIEPKFDGIGVEVIYKNGQLHQAITRGDGITGDDITHNVKTIQNLPKKLKANSQQLAANKNEILIFRGEIMMPKSVRQDINDQRIKEDKQVFANTRNAAA